MKEIHFNVFTASADTLGCSIKIDHKFRPDFAATCLSDFLIKKKKKENEFSFAIQELMEIN